MKTNSIIPVFVDTIPNHLEDGVLYICERYKTASHKCCCGCGEEVVTPLTPVDWSVHKVEDMVSLKPSIGNWSFGCRSHYYIHNSRVIWAATFPQWKIDIVRKRDKADKKVYIKAINQQKSKTLKIMVRISNLWEAIIHWLKS